MNTAPETLQLPHDVLTVVGLVYACAGDLSRLPQLVQALQMCLGDSGDHPINDRAGLDSIAASLRLIEISGNNAAWAGLISQVLPHLDQAISISKRLDSAPGVDVMAGELLRLMPFPCIFTDQLSRCVERNAAFDDAQQQLSVRLAVGRIRFASRDLQGTWDSALADVYLTAAGQTISAAAADGKPWRIHLVPLQTVMRGDGGGSKLVMAVFDNRPLDPQLSAQVLHSQAQLTRAELEVLGCLLQGMPAKAIASQRGVSVNTVRVQIMAILDKTGYTSQREVMAAFSNSSFGGSISYGASSSFKPVSPQGRTVPASLAKASAPSRDG